MSVLKIEHNKPTPKSAILDLGNLRLYIEDVGSNQHIRIAAVKVDGNEETEPIEGLFDTKDTDILVEMLQGFRAEIGPRG